jgi:ribosomal protein L22
MTDKEPKKDKVEEKKEEKKVEEKKPVETKKEVKEEKKSPEVKPEKKGEKPEVKEKVKEKKEEKPAKKEPKKEAPKVPKKDEAVAYGVNLHASTKQCQYICKFIKNKVIDQATADLQEVIRLKKAVPFKGEIPHRKGKGMMSGRYPVKASKLFISMLKSLRGNVIVNGMDLDQTKILIASASIATRPMKTGGREAKRTNIILKAREVKAKETKVKTKTETGEKK